MAETYSVSLEKLIEQMELENVTKDVDVSRIDIVQTDVNRPALQLAGFFDYFDSGRIQIIGHVEHTYMEQKGLDYTLEMMEIIMAGSERHTKPPCIVFCRDLHIDEELIRLADLEQCDLVLTTGGTGFSMRDVTPEATLAVSGRVAPGIAEAIRAGSMAITKRAMLSRAVSAIRHRTLIINLPGSPKAVEESLGFVLDTLPHALGLLRGTDGECGRS